VQIGALHKLYINNLRVKALLMLNKALCREPLCFKGLRTRAGVYRIDKLWFGSYQGQETLIAPKSPNRFWAHPNFFLGVKRLNLDS